MSLLIFPILLSQQQLTLPLDRSYSGKTLFVGGTGPGNYSVIQYAVENASEGDTVFVYNGVYSDYFEEKWACVRIEKSIQLLGEDKEKTIINGSGSMRVVYIHASNVIVSGFTLQNGGSTNQSGAFGRGIDLVQQLNNVEIYDNIIQMNYQAIGVQFESTQVFIHDNIITNNYEGFENGPNIFGLQLTNNTFSDNQVALPLTGHDFHVSHNVFINNDVGIELYDGKFDSVIEHNHLQNNTIGIHLLLTRSTIRDNNFIANKHHVELYKAATILLIPLLPLFRQHWRSNYWDDWNYTKPRPIWGTCGLFIFTPIPKPYAQMIAEIPYVEYDYHPAQQPHYNELERLY